MPQGSLGLSTVGHPLKPWVTVKGELLTYLSPCCILAASSFCLVYPEFLSTHYHPVVGGPHRNDNHTVMINFVNPSN